MYFWHLGGDYCLTLPLPGYAYVYLRGLALSLPPPLRVKCFIQKFNVKIC